MRHTCSARSFCLFAGTLFTALLQASGAEAGPRIEADIPSYVAREALSGELGISVAEGVKPLVQAWADDLMSLYPELQIVVISERSHTNLTVLLGQQTEMMAMSRRMTPGEVGNCLLEFGDRPIAVPVAHQPHAIFVGNDDQPGYKTGPVKPLRVDSMVNNQQVAPVARGEMNALYTFRRSVYLYSAKSQRERAIHASGELVRYALSRQGQQLALDLGYVPLSFEEVRRVTSHWSASRR